MAEGAAQRNRLEGEVIVFTGRMAAFTRSEAAAVAIAEGAVVAPTVTRATTLVVIGHEGWPLRRDGRLTGKLRRAAILAHRGQRLEVIRESEWLERLGLDNRQPHLLRRYTLRQLAEMLKLPRDRLRRWVRAGWIRPCEQSRGIAWFDFAQAAGIKTLSAALEAGVSPRRLRRSLAELKRWFPETEALAGRLEFLAGATSLGARTSTGRLSATNGQLLLDFHEDASPAAVEFVPQANAAEPIVDVDALFAEAVAAEDRGDIPEAIRIYRHLLEISEPDSEIHFNLGNALFAAGDTNAAVEELRHAVSIDGTFVAAWNNLAHVFADTGHPDEARRAYEHALEADPGDATARGNLALLLDEHGQPATARLHWAVYLRLAPAGDLAPYANDRLTRSRA